MKSIPKITVAVAIGLIVFAAGASTAQTKPAARRPDIYTLWSLTNEERAKAGLAPLALDPKLDQSASAKCAANVSYKTFDHVLPDGRQPYDFIRKYDDNTWKYAGENLSFDVHDTANSQDTMTGWMNSPHHKENLLNPIYNHVGFAICHADSLSNFGSGELTVQQFTAE